MLIPIVVDGLSPAAHAAPQPMPLPAGTKLGPYEILAQIGAGGMGEVYRASDSRLGRTVAIKVLPDSFSDSAEMKQRFEREARTVAALNHPNICTLHDIGRAEITVDGAAAPTTVDYLVMEHLEGETLADRLGRGPLPLDRALAFGIQMADALEKAHAKGVTHRDLKPGNVMLTPSGAKLLDFGLAKVTQPRATPGSGPSVALTRPPATTPGTVMGTMQYMAPEQLEGNEADARSDLFSFGAVLYEMITGRKAFAGKSQAHLIAAILSAEPEKIATLTPGAPRALDFLLGRCLEKDPEQRLQTATDLVWELRWIAAGGAHGTLQGRLQRRRLARAAPVALGAVGLLVAALAVLAFRAPEAEPGTPSVFVIDVGDMPVPEAVALAPDGVTVAFAARDGGGTAVFVRPLDVDVPQRLAGTEGAGRVFWSPDGKQVAFFAAGRLKRVAASGGGVENIADTADLLGGTWNAGGDILFGSSQGLKRVRAAGGRPEPVELSLPEGAGLPQEPYFLPDGRRFLFLAGPAPGDGDGSDAAGSAAIYAASLDAPDVKRLVEAQSNPVYAAPGHLLYHSGGTLYAQPFDADALMLDGAAVRLADGLPRSTSGAAAFAASQTGVLLYRNVVQREAVRPGSATSSTGIGREPPLVWVDKQGRGTVAADARRWVGVDLAADGRAAFHRHDGDGGDVWLLEPNQTTPVRFTFDGTQDNSNPVWSPDGERIAFGSRRDGRFGIYVKRSDNTRDEELVVESEVAAMPMSWSADGREIVYWAGNERTRGDIWRVRAETDATPREPVAVAATPFDERNPQVSPDGRWLAYSSNQTGRSEIYVQPFPSGAGRIQVSVDGGVFPRWHRDGSELYFMSLVSYGALMASSIDVRGGTVRREVPRRLFQSYFISQAHAAGAYHAYAVAADGQRFLVPQFDTVGAAFGVGTGNQAVAAVIALVMPAVVADRTAAGGSAAEDGGPITVMLNWPAAAEH
jgi:Tol biopolymer transport system component